MHDLSRMPPKQYRCAIRISRGEKRKWPHSRTARSASCSATPPRPVLSRLLWKGKPCRYVVTLSVTTPNLSSYANAVSRGSPSCSSSTIWTEVAAEVANAALALPRSTVPRRELFCHPGRSELLGFSDDHATKLVNAHRQHMSLSHSLASSARSECCISLSGGSTLDCW